MIERDFIQQKTKEYQIKKHLESKLKGVGISSIVLKKIPLGEKIIIQAARPSLIVGSKGANIRELTTHLKKNFGLENPQIEIAEVKDYFLDANIVASRIAGSLERFGSARFKSIGHRILENIMQAGALGVEVVLSGKIPGARARSWRFYQGYLKKCGDIAFSGVNKAQETALLKTGIIGIRVSIMPPNVVLPDHVEILDEPIQVVVEEVKEEKKTTKKKTTKKKPAKKKVAEPKESPEEKKEEVKAEAPKVGEKAEEVTKEPVVEEKKVEEKVEESTQTPEETKTEEPVQESQSQEDKKEEVVEEKKE